MRNEKPFILIADDEKEIRDILQLLLTGDGYEVIAAENGKEAVALAAPEVDLYILDVNMPELSGFMAGAEIRKQYDAPIVFLTAYSGESDKVMGFAAGADDYIVKPFSNMELLMRIKAILRRSVRAVSQQISASQPGADSSQTTTGQPDAGSSQNATGQPDAGSLQNTTSQPCTDTLQNGITGAFDEASNETPVIPLQDLLLDLDSKSAIRDDQVISLTYTEFKILELLASHKKKIFSLDNIYESIWDDEVVADAAIMVHIKNIRKKLGDDSRNPKYIKTAWGRGYYVE